MFEHGSSERSAWIASFIAQQFLAAIGPLLLLIGVANLFGTYQQSAVSDVTVIYVTVAGVGFLLGYGVGRVVPRSIVAGKWIWAAPICLLLAAWTDELWINARPPYGPHAFRKTMAEFFYPDTVSGYVGMTFFTVPAWSCLCNASGAIAAKRNNARTQHK